jgi:hypothetical protein
VDGFHAAVSPSAGRDDPRIAPGLGSRARQVHQAASFGDGDALGPVKTDVLVLLGRGTLFSAPFRNSISRALLADHAFECSDLCFVLLKKNGRASILIKCPSLKLLDPDSIKLREMSWRLESRAQ